MAQQVQLPTAQVRGSQVQYRSLVGRVVSTELVAVQKSGSDAVVLLSCYAGGSGLRHDCPLRDRRNHRQLLLDVELWQHLITDR